MLTPALHLHAYTEMGATGHAEWVGRELGSID